MAGASGAEAAHDAVELQLTGVPGVSHGVRFPDLSLGRFWDIPAIWSPFVFEDEAFEGGAQTRLPASVVSWNAKKADRSATRPNEGVIDSNIVGNRLFRSN